MIMLQHLNFRDTLYQVETNALEIKVVAKISDLKQGTKVYTYCGMYVFGRIEKRGSPNKN